MTRSPDHPITRSPDLLVLPRLYAIIDPAQAGGRSPVEVATALLAAGVRLIQLRDKHASSRELYESAQRVAECVHKAGGIFIVNDRADVARAEDADGVHVGQEDLPVEAARALVGPGKLVGYSTHVLEQVREADRSTADYVAFGPIFPTASKVNPDPVVGLGGLAEARKATRKPLVAIGGITLENARAVIDAGADCVAVIRALVGAPDIRKRAEAFIERLSGVGNGKG
jgi:thiamine-phosphate diphosphorylase